MSARVIRFPGDYRSAFVFRSGTRLLDVPALSSNTDSVYVV